MSDEVFGMSIDERMNSLVTKYNLTLDEVKKMYEAHLYKIEADASIPRTKDQAEHAAIMKTMLEVENKYGQPVGEFSPKKVRNEPVELEGWLIARGDYRNKKEEMKSMIEAFKKKNGMQASKLKGFIDNNGIPLDYRTQVYGRDNPNYGKPLDGVDIDIEMSLYGYARRIGTTDPFVFSKFSTTITAVSNSWHKSIKFPEHAFLPVKFWGLVKETKFGYNITSSSVEDKKTAFSVIKNASFDPYVEFDKVVELTNVIDVGEHYVTHQKEFDRTIFVKGVLDKIMPQYTGKEGVPAKLCDENDIWNRVDVRIPMEYADKFGNASTVIVFGKDKEKNRLDENSGEWIPTGEPKIVCSAVLEVPGLRISPIRDKVTLKEFMAFKE